MEIALCCLPILFLFIVSWLSQTNSLYILDSCWDCGAMVGLVVCGALIVWLVLSGVDSLDEDVFFRTALFTILVAVWMGLPILLLVAHYWMRSSELRRLEPSDPWSLILLRAWGTYEAVFLGTVAFVFVIVSASETASDDMYKMTRCLFTFTGWGCFLFLCSWTWTTYQCYVDRETLSPLDGDTLRMTLWGIGITWTLWVLALPVVLIVTLFFVTGFDH